MSFESSFFLFPYAVFILSSKIFLLGTYFNLEKYEAIFKYNISQMNGRQAGTPIFKGGSKSNPGNYRPISIIPVIAKIFEKIIFDQLYEYLNTNDMLTANLPIWF